MRAFASLLRLPSQSRLLAASIPADFSDWMDYVAVIALLTYVWGSGPLVLAFFALALSVPYVIAGPVVATLVDRTDLRRTLVLSNLGRAAVTVALIFAPNVEIVLVLVFLRSTIDSAFTPAKQAAIQLLTPPELLMSANSLHHLVNQSSKVAGPALGGLLLAAMPPAGVFVVTAGLSLVAAIILFGLVLPRPAPSKTTAPSAFFGEVPQGFAEFLHNSQLRDALVFTAAAYFALFLYDTLIVLLAAGFGFDAPSYGLLITAAGAGGVLGALLAGRITNKRPLTVMALAAVFSGCITTALAGAAMAGIALPLAAFLAAMLGMGAAMAFMLVPFRSIVQRHAPPAKMARVIAASEAVTMLAMLSAPFIGSAIAAAAGVPASFLSGGLLLLLIGVAALVRELRHRPA